MQHPDQQLVEAPARQRPVRTLLIAALLVVVVVVTLVVMLRVDGSSRGAVPIQDAWLTEPDRLVLVVETCNGEPEVTELNEGSLAVHVRVESLKESGGGGNSCQDVIEVQLEEPRDDHMLIDLLSARVFDEVPTI